MSHQSIKIDIEMMDLLLNLISEAIGILVTVLIVDRLLEKHEERRWQEVRTLFLSRANRSCQMIVNAWKGFLIAVSQKEQNDKLTTREQEIKAFQEMQTHPWLFQGGFPSVPFSFDERWVENHLGKPLGIKLDEFSMHCGEGDINMAITKLVPYLIRNFPHPEDIAWSNLYKRLTPPVQELNDLLEKYSRVVDPEFAKAVIRLSTQVDNLKSGMHGKVEQNTQYWKATSPLRATLGAKFLAEGLRASLELQYYINQYHTNRLQAPNR